MARLKDSSVIVDSNGEEKEIWRDGATGGNVRVVNGVVNAAAFDDLETARNYANSQSYSTIFLPEGTYNVDSLTDGQLRPADGQTWIGSNPETTIIETTVDSNTAVRLSRSNVTIRGIGIQADGVGIGFSGSEVDNLVERCIIHESGGDSISVDGEAAIVDKTIVKPNAGRVFMNGGTLDTCEVSGQVYVNLSECRVIGSRVGDGSTTAVRFDDSSGDSLIDGCIVDGEVSVSGSATGIEQGTNVILGTS